MRWSILEIRWHDTKPIFSCDFQPFECVQHKRQLNPYQRTAGNISDGDGKLYRLATTGGDNTVRIWLAIPNPPLPPPASALSANANSKEAKAAAAAGPSATVPGQLHGKPKVEYLATLDRHQLTVNVVRFSPSGHLLATAGDDAGNAGILIWRLSANPATATFGNRSADDAAYEKEAWQAIKAIKASSPEVYDLAWSPDGQYLLAGGTDGAARIYRVADGICVAEMTDHKDWVQGVAWDPLNKFIATQGKDRQMMVYSLSEGPDGTPKVTLLSKTARLTSKKPATNSPPMASSSTLPSVSDTNSAEDFKTPSLPQASSATAPPPASTSQIMYGDEESTPFFRRLAFSTDGALLVTPAGQYEDPSGSSKKGKSSSRKSTNGGDANASVVITSSSPVIEKKSSSSSSKPSSSTGGISLAANGKLKKSSTGPASTSYIFARGQLANETPIAHLPGHRTASIVVKFNPVLWNLRSKKSSNSSSSMKGKEKARDEVNGQIDEETTSVANQSSVDGMQVDTTAALEEAQQSTSQDGGNDADGMFKLKQRTIYAIATHESILVYDTQQEAPICMFSTFHYAAFTDLAWTPDGLSLIATSSDGYASMFTFEEGELGIPAAEQPKRSMGPLEDSLVNGTSTMSPAKPTATSITSSPATTTTGGLASSSTTTSTGGNIFKAPLAKEDSDIIMLSSEPGNQSHQGEQKKIKKRAALTHIGPLGSSAI